jgi:L-lysine 6-transaminase
MSFSGDEDALRNVQLEEGRALAQIRAVFESSPGEIAAIVIEPIQSYGDGFFRSEFLTLLRQICDERDSILIFDERLTGFGVTAQWWDWQNHEVKPDILIFGDRAQVSGIAATERLDEVGPLLRDFANSQRRFSGNLLDMVRCHRIIEIIRDDDLLANARNMGAYLLKLLSDLPKSHSEVSGVRGRGLWAGFDLPSTEERDKVAWSCYDEQLLVARSGSRAIRLRPTLDVNADAVGRAVAQLEAGIRRAYGRRA